MNGIGQALIQLVKFLGMVISLILMPLANIYKMLSGRHSDKRKKEERK